MKARQRIASASYGPDELKALGKAFDDAWDRVSPHISDRAGAIEAARLTLADIVLGLAMTGNFDSARPPSRAPFLCQARLILCHDEPALFARRGDLELLQRARERGLIIGRVHVAQVGRPRTADPVGEPDRFLLPGLGITRSSCAHNPVM
jgi:hypothetical protein